MKTIDIENLAVMFRQNDPNLGHVSTLEAMEELGLSYMYGVWRGTPKCYKAERRRLREAIAFTLEHKAHRKEPVI